MPIRDIFKQNRESFQRDTEALQTAFEQADLPAIQSILEQTAVSSSSTNLPKRFNTAYFYVDNIQGVTSLFCFYSPNRWFGHPPYYNITGEIPPVPVSQPQQENCKNIIRYLVGNDLNQLGLFRDNGFGQLPLSTAIGFDHTPAALAIIELITEIPDRNIRTKLLNDFNSGGASEVSAENTSSPLLLSIQKGNLEIFRALLATNCINIMKTDRFGLTALHWAVIMGIPEMFDALIQKGAHAHAMAHNNKKPIDYLIPPKYIETACLPLYKVIRDGKEAEQIPASVRDWSYQKTDMPHVYVKDGQRVTITSQANSTFDPGMRQICAMFENSTDEFLRRRQERLNKDVRKAMIQRLRAIPEAEIPPITEQPPSPRTHTTEQPGPAMRSMAPLAEHNSSSSPSAPAAPHIPRNGNSGGSGSGLQGGTDDGLNGIDLTLPDPVKPATERPFTPFLDTKMGCFRGGACFGDSGSRPRVEPPHPPHTLPKKETGCLVM